MRAIGRFRVVSCFLAVKLSADEQRFTTVPVGAIIETSEDLQDAGMVTITMNGIRLLAFHCDIMERAELIQDRSLSQGA